MNYNETIDYLFNKTLVFQHVGAQAYKPGLETTLRLAELFGNPQDTFQSVHVAGTNGKGSTSHLIAATLMDAGYKVGLYTSPHLSDFRERIRVDGKPVPKDFVVDFVSRFLASGYSGRQPSFFELTTIMAFAYFKEAAVDYAVIEVGLGGRLDCTNILSPILSVITNISFDHTQFLGNTLAEIATEKAGIIKPHTPVIVGEYTDETRPVFQAKADAENAPIVFAEDSSEIAGARHTDSDGLDIETRSFGTLHAALTGDCQLKNADTVLHALQALSGISARLSADNVRNGFADVCRTTGLLGRWTTVAESPKVICDTAHNPGGFQYIARQLERAECTALRIIIGFVGDKDIDRILGMLPGHATYYFTRPSVERALPKEILMEKAGNSGLKGKWYATVEEAYRQATADASATDMIYVGGSTFIVADFLTTIQGHRQDG